MFSEVNQRKDQTSDPLGRTGKSVASSGTVPPINAIKTCAVDQIRWRDAIFQRLLRRRTYIFKSKALYWLSIIAFCVGLFFSLNLYLIYLLEDPETSYFWCIIKVCALCLNTCLNFRCTVTIDLNLANHNTTCAFSYGDDMTDRKTNPTTSVPSFGGNSKHYKKLELVITVLCLVVALVSVKFYFTYAFDFPFKISPATRKLLEIEEDDIKHRYWKVHSTEQADCFTDMDFLDWIYANRHIPWLNYDAFKILHEKIYRQQYSQTFPSSSSSLLSKSLPLSSRSGPFPTSKFSSAAPFLARAYPSPYLPRRSSCSVQCTSRSSISSLTETTFRSSSLPPPPSEYDETEEPEWQSPVLKFRMPYRDMEYQRQHEISPQVFHSLKSLSRLRYQRCPTPHDAAMDRASDHFCSKNVSMKLGVSDAMLKVWSERIRNWLAATVLDKIVKEIDELNKAFRNFGYSTVEIGETNLCTLWNIAFSSSDIFPTLLSVVPYLDLTLEQTYIVQRLRDLSSGKYMKLFIWNSGGSYDGRAWRHDLPTDSAIIMHLFCTYLDTLFPIDPSTIDGWMIPRPFTFKYLKKLRGKKADGHYIYNAEVTPPHYDIVIDHETYALAKGKCNVFSAIALFLHCIKVKEDSMLERIQLGPAGLNVLWALEPDEQ